MILKDGVIVESDNPNVMPYEEASEAVAMILDGIGSCSHQTAPLPLESELEILYAYFEQGDYAESSGAFIARRADGMFLAGWESEDTSGHGCQCAGELVAYGSMVDAVQLGLGQDDRDRIRAVAPKETLKRKTEDGPQAWRMVSGRLEPV
jgi:hypothetical protein